MLLFLASCVFIGERTGFEPDEPGIYLLSTCGGTEIGDTRPGCALGNPTGLQYRSTFTAPSTGVWVFSTQDIDTVLQVFERDVGGEIGCDDDALENYGSQVRVYLQQEQTVDLVVTSFEDCGDFRMHVALEPEASCADLLAPSWERDAPGLMPQYGELELRFETERDWFDVLVPADHRCYFYSDASALLSLDDPSTEGIDVLRFTGVTVFSGSNADLRYLLRAEPSGTDSSTCPAYPLLSFCSACVDADDYEPNNSAETAAFLSPSLEPYALSFSRGGDQDWFLVPVGVGQDIQVSAVGDVTGLLLSDTSGNAVQTDTDGTDGFSLSASSLTSDGYVVQVVGLDCGFYDLTIEVQ